MIIEETQQLLAVLTRIAAAFEEQNTMNAAHVAWLKETYHPDVGPDIVAIHREQARHNEAWIDEQRKMLEAQIAKQTRILEEVPALWLDNLKAQRSVLQETVDALCEQVGVAKPDWNSMGGTA